MAAANNNAKLFTNETIKYFKLIGIVFEGNHRLLDLVLMAGLCNLILILLGQIIHFSLFDVDFQELAAGVTYMNYFMVSVGKIIALLYNRQAIQEMLTEFHQIYPSTHVEKANQLTTYLEQYQLIEKILLGFFKSIAFLYNISPVVSSFVDLRKVGNFTYRTPLFIWYPFDNHVWFKYVPTYLLQVHSSYMVAIIILGLDLCLFSSLLQLCMHFDLINKNILQIDPNGSEDDEVKLKEQIAYHQMVLRLADKVNEIFTPSVLYSLLSSSVIMCFCGYQLLQGVSMAFVFKVMFLLGYELKQVVITCFLGDRLINVSVEISNSIYEHNWYNGTASYKRLVLMVLRRSQEGIALNVAGISDVSLQTFRQVMSMSYQIFTVLKSGST